MLNDKDWQTFQAIWKRHREQVLSCTPADHQTAEAAVDILYRVLNRNLPTKLWVDGALLDHDEISGMPISHLLDHVLGGVWLSLLPEINELATLMGYNPATGGFRISDNKTLIFKDFFRFRRHHRQFIRGPVWSHNLICQFDAPSLALYEFIISRNDYVPINDHLLMVAAACKRVLESTFGVVLFEQTCLLIDRPKHILLDPQYMLSSTQGQGPAFELGKECIYAVNGVVIPKLTIDLIRHDMNRWHGTMVWQHFDQMTPRLRVASIEYIGWDKFLSITPRRMISCLDEDKRFGTLLRIVCGNQIMTVVQVMNSTAEPDGTFRKYVIPVDHDLRPIPNSLDPLGVMGAPQDMTALNAVASTFGMTGKTYVANLAAES